MTTITTLHILYARLSLWRLFPQATALWVLKTPAAGRGVATGRESRPRARRAPEETSAESGGSLGSSWVALGAALLATNEIFLVYA